MKLLAAAGIAFAVMMWAPAPVSAGGSVFATPLVRPGSGRSGSSLQSSQSRSFAVETGRHGGRVVLGHPSQRRFDHHNHQHFRRHRHFDRPLIVVPHHHLFLHHDSHVVVINSPFFCFLHETGFVSRVGLLDHLSGTHKFPIETAAAICPDEESCVFTGF